ncbi:MAG TPA: EVE domain-containing protein [Candidatus Paceibacterota bacterium]|jgi:predicted RNA-binding protein with PUA-like domain|nr:EVE domain-containing protein [Candidatus Paceibacterota bacterium]
MKNYWLLKTESDAFSIDDLKRAGKEPWTGVRNFQARNNLAVMKEGDLCLIYHTGDEKAVVGVAKVASEPYADPTQFDKKSHYYEPKSTKEKSVWVLVDVAFVKKLPHPVTLAEIKLDPKLAAMMLVHAPRLSVQPVSEKQFKYIAEELAV